ncbi:DUF4377 domain-containing protein [Fluviicola sp.]|uniref:DUF4377 domain-containing protein n=1 Tax=Fluviicola sp. TaxID=1917219 RepID=UPI00260AB95E|nr:DUF4377 domain-containing protein [Fluviicola sp.]
MLKIVWLAISLTSSNFGGTTLFPAEQTAIALSGETIKMRVGAHLVNCSGNAEETKKCYSVQKGATIGMDSWEVLPQPIEGFNFEAGFTYDLIVKIDLVEGKTGAERFKYTLVQIISKIKE